MNIEKILKRTQGKQTHQGLKKSYFLAICLILLFSIGGIGFLLSHGKSKTDRMTKERDTDEARGQRVEVAKVKKTPPSREIEVMGETRAFFSVTLYARVSGYMTGLFADIGDPVRQGQTLAHVESPEQEQAYNSARANAINLRRISDRAQALRRRKLISQQQADQALSDAAVSEANLRTQSVLRGYQDIVAPFDGIISNRYVDPGWLLQNASGAQSASQPLFTLTQSNPLRVFSYIDQKDAPFVRYGDPVTITLAEQPNIQYHAKIDKIAAELDPRTRTLLTESIMENSDNGSGSPAVVAGSFVRVRLKVQTPEYLSVPIQALVMQQKQPYVSLVENGDKIHYAKIEIAENDGENVLIRSGVREGEEVALNLGNSAREGQKIQIAHSNAQAAGTARSPDKQ